MRPSERAERLLWVLAFAALVCARMPNIVIYGRFWAEEGTPCFTFGWTKPWYEALVSAYGGYVSVVPNLAGILARHLAPLEDAPYVTIAIALLIQSCPAILLATARDDFLAGRWRLIAALLLVATPPDSEEVWLTTTHAQVHLALCAVLILALQPRGGALGVFRLALLLLAAFSGPGAWFLAPLFAARAAIDRSWGRAMQGAVLALGAIVQVLFFVHARPDRMFAGPRMQLLIFFVRHLLIPFLGNTQASAIATPLYVQVMTGQAPIWPMALTMLALGGLAAAITVQRSRTALWLFLAGMTLAIAGYSGAIRGRENLLFVYFGQRYAFVPTVAFGLSLLALGFTAPARAQVLARALVVWLIVIGAHEYFVPSAQYWAAGPDWRAEVAAWRADPTRRLAVWPEPWSLRLPAGAH